MAMAYTSLKQQLPLDRQSALTGDQRRWLHQLETACAGSNENALFQCLTDEEQSRQRFLADRSASQVMTRIGPDAVWNPAIPPVCKGASSASCLLNAMKNSGASPSALGLAAYWNMGGYLKSIIHYGKIDAGIMYTPLSMNNNEQPVLLNGDPPIVDVWDQVVKNVNLSSARQMHPNADISSNVPNLMSAAALSDGGQRFTYAVSARECHACPAVADYEVALDFDRNGKYVGPKTISEKLR